MAGTERRSPLLLVGADADTAFYAGRATERGGPVLVLGSGRGRLAFGLAERGLDVVAVDPSERMAEAAEARRSEQPEDVAARVRLLQADPRVLRLSERFATVVAPQNALGLARSLADLDAFLATVRFHLRAGGAFYLDVLNPDPEEPDPEDGPVPTGHVPFEPRRPPFRPHLRERKTLTAQSGPIRRLALRAFSAAELRRALESHGLPAHEAFGDFYGKAFEPEDGLQVLGCERLDG